MSVMIAVPLLLLSVLGVAAVLAGSSRQHASAKATVLAVQALRDKIAEIQDQANRSMGDVYTTYTWAASASFDVPAVAGVHPGLTPAPGHAHVGTILCWNDETGARLPTGANEGDSARVGLPRDLNMDDDADDQSVLSFDMKVVPMKVALDFMDASGPRHVEVFYLAASQPQ